MSAASARTASRPLTPPERCSYRHPMASQAAIEEYAAIYRAREVARRQAMADRAEHLRALLPEAARVLREEFGATRVGVFGSLATPTRRFGEGSDVDVYVDSLRRGRYFEAVDRLTLLFGADVDLVELARAPEGLRAHIDAEGVDVD